MVVGSVKILMLLSDPDFVLVEGTIMINKVFVGLVDTSEVDRREESWWMKF